MAFVDLSAVSWLNFAHHFTPHLVPAVIYSLLYVIITVLHEDLVLFSLSPPEHHGRRPKYL